MLLLFFLSKKQCHHHSWWKSENELKVQVKCQKWKGIYHIFA